MSEETDKGGFSFTSRLNLSRKVSLTEVEDSLKSQFSRYKASQLASYCVRVRVFSRTALVAALCVCVCVHCVCEEISLALHSRRVCTRQAKR